MSELKHGTTNWERVIQKLLATTSALAVMTIAAARAGEEGHDTVWIELGGQMEAVQGEASSFAAPFMAIEPHDGFYKNSLFAHMQRPARTAFGLEGSLNFEPAGTDWIFSARIRYGRSHANRFRHYQTSGITRPGGRYEKTADGGRHFLSYATEHYHLESQAFVQPQTHSAESHMVLDFSVGREVGIGMLGQEGESNINGGIRLAQLSARSSATIYARPNVSAENLLKYPFYIPRGEFTGFSLTGSSERSFHGIGPSLSWNASAAVLGHRDSGELSFDWGINGAILFGRQKTITSHSTAAKHFSRKLATYTTVYPARAYQSSRSRSIAAPNLGGFAALSVRYPNLKVSLGYRADFFFGAMDTGIDTRHTQTVGFNGPFAAISIGLGG